ncbi:MAG: DUF3368 domain-containing protein [Candidatus Bathyarchaeota archaeon]
MGVWIIKSGVKTEIVDYYQFIDTNTRLGTGEKEVLKLCKQLRALYFLADDREARRVSIILNIKPVGTLGVLVKAYRQGLVTKAEVLQILEALMKAGFRMSVSVYRRVLNEMET